MADMIKKVQDLGVAAYLRMHGFRVQGRKGRDIFFQIDEKDSGEFQKSCIEYVNSPFHEFDSHIMSLKKIAEYMPS